MAEKNGGEYSKSYSVCAGTSLFLIFRELKLKYAYPQMEGEQFLQRGGLINENKDSEEN